MDTTARVVDIIDDALKTVPVSTEVPLQRPARFVMVSLEGDESDGFFLRPRYSLMCWGTTDIDAHGLAVSALHALTDAAQTDHYLFRVDLESMARDEWGNDGQARYAVTVDLLFNTDETP